MHQGSSSTKGWDHRGNDACRQYNGNIWITWERIGLDLERSQVTKDPTPGFVTRSEEQAMIAAEMKKSAAHRNPPLQTRLVEDEPINAPHASYISLKVGMNTPFFNSVGCHCWRYKARKIDSLIIWSIETISKPEKFKKHWCDEWIDASVSSRQLGSRWNVMWEYWKMTLLGAKGPVSGLRNNL